MQMEIDGCDHLLCHFPKFLLFPGDTHLVITFAIASELLLHLYQYRYVPSVLIMRHTAKSLQRCTLSLQASSLYPVKAV